MLNTRKQLATNVESFTEINAMRANVLRIMQGVVERNLVCLDYYT